MADLQRIIWLAGLLLFLSPGFILGQMNIEGKVRDGETGKPLAGANIMVPETQSASITNEEGYFRLIIPENVDAIRISFVGYFAKEVIISDTSRYLDIRLSPREHGINEVVVKGERRRPGELLFHQTALLLRGIENEGSVSNTSVYNKLQRQPGIYVESQDLSGLSEKTVRIRGINSHFSGMTLEGIPNYGVMPIGPRDYLYDMENIRSVRIHKGAVPAGVFSATGNKGGVIRLDLKDPQEKFGIMARQSMGSDAYVRSFLRVDAGKLSTGTRLFGSLSYTKSDKWKGPGKIGPRYNLSLALTQDFGKKIHAKLFFLHDRLSRHDFRELTYAQAENITNNYRLHFLDNPFTTAFDKAYYYDNNKGSFLNTAIYSHIQYEASENLTFSMKPYFSVEDADYWHKQITGPPQNSNYMLFNRMRKTPKGGVIAQAFGKLGGTALSAGYWLEVNDLSARVHVYKLQNDAERLDLGINPMTENTAPGAIHNPYVQLSGSPGDFHWHAGLKYFYYSGANTNNYNVSGGMKTPAPSLDVKDLHYASWLPTLGVGYSFTGELDLSFGYGKNYMRPYMYGPMKSLYLREHSKFLENGVMFEDILKGWEMETSDQLTFRAKWDKERFDLEFSPFYAMHHDVLTPVLDSDVDVQYYQNVGEVKAYGMETTGNVNVSRNIAFFFNATFMNMAYDQNITTGNEGAEQIFDIIGNQSPSVPKWSGIAGLRYIYGEFSLSALMRRVGKRHGDATNQEKLPPYDLVNIKGGYELDLDWAVNFNLGLEIKNLLNTRYVGRIVVMDYEHGGNASYYAGMPRAFAVTLTSKF